MNIETAKKILILDKVDPKAAEILEAAGFQVDIKESLTPEELKSIIPDYAAVIIRSKTKMTADIIEAGTKLEVIGRAGAGIDNIDVDVAKAKGILVMNADGNTISAAEHAFAMMLAMAHNITAADASMKAGLWEKSKFVGVELNEKVLGIIGLGRVGSALARMAHGLNMKVIAVEPNITREKAAELNVDLNDTKSELIKNSDFISLHTPKLTEYILGSDEFKVCKKGVFIINCARDGLIDPKALREALEDGTVAGVGMDVFEGEPVENGRGNQDELKIIPLSKSVTTPHLGASTTDAQIRVAEMIARQVGIYLQNGTIEGAVNAPSLSAEDRKTLRPYLMLASQLGSLVGQITLGNRVQGIEIDYAGEAAKLKYTPLTDACLEWLLKSQNVEANSINARKVATDRGVGIKETVRSDGKSNQPLMRVRVTTDKGSVQVSGTLTDKNEPRVVGIDNIKLEAKIAAHMLFVRSNNKPGIVGLIGTVLASSKYNIRNIHMSETKGRTENVSFITVNRKISPHVLDELKEAGGNDIIAVHGLKMNKSLIINRGP
jgi:D-3-phosphoglycerate dehydrogenase / 2-oxoglutarate reductase